MTADMFVEGYVQTVGMFVGDSMYNVRWIIYNDLLGYFRSTTSKEERGVSLLKRTNGISLH